MPIATRCCAVPVSIGCVFLGCCPADMSLGNAVVPVPAAMGGFKIGRWTMFCDANQPRDIAVATVSEQHWTPLLERPADALVTFVGHDNVAEIGVRFAVIVEACSLERIAVANPAH